MVSFDADALHAHRQLVARLGAGDRDAMHLLYRELSPVVHGIVRRMLDDPEEAREAVQDTFIKAWQQAGKYRAERGEVVSWLVLIARNAAIDRVRQGARRRQLYETFAREAEALPPEPPEPLGAHRELLDSHLACLTGAQRRALELAFFAGCTQSEISAAMQTPVGTVKNHLRRGLSRLRKLIGHDA